MTEKKRLLGMTLDELKAVAAEVSLPNWLPLKSLSRIMQPSRWRIGYIKRK